MGCTSSKGPGHKVLRVNTRCGSLKITILNCHLERNTNAVMTMDPYVKIKVSNQSKLTEIRKKGGYDPQFDANF
jgi:Ca2+-dependent lipid-binding protein